jgi:hypothetical protein
MPSFITQPTEEEMKQHRHDDEKRPFGCAFQIDGEKIMKSKASVNAYKGWAFSCEMERLMRVKQYRLLEQIYKSVDMEMILTLFKRNSDLHGFLEHMVYAKKMEWIDETMFSSDPDVKECFSEDAIVQMSGVLKHRVKESQDYQEMLHFICEKCDTPQDVIDFKDFFRETMEKKGAVGIGEPPQVSGICLSLPEEDAKQTVKTGCFVSPKCFTHKMINGTLNPDNPMKNTIQEKVIGHKIHSIFVNPTDYDFDIDSLLNSEEAIGNYIVKHNISI